MAYYHQNYTIFKRGKYYYYQTYTPDGMRTTAKTTHCTTKSAARLFCDDLLKRGLLFSGSSMTFKAFAEGFFDDGSVWVQDRLALGTEDRPGISEGSLRKYRGVLSTHLLPFFGEHKLQDITPTLVKQFRQWCLQEQELSAKSTNSVMGVFRLICESALADNIMMFDPMRGIKVLKTEERTIGAFTLDQAKTLLNKELWTSEDFWLMNLTAALTGMRSSELMAIRPDTIHVNYIEVKDQRIRGTLSPCKTQENRIVPIPEELSAMLLEHCEGEFCFSAYQDTYLKQLRKAMDKTNIEYETDKNCLKFHSWRHFANTYYLSKNVPKVKVDSIIGHSDSQTKVQAIYTHFRAEDYEDFYKVQKDLYELLV